LASKMRDGEIDLHGYGRRLERAIRFLNTHPKVSKKNKEKILQFLERLKAEGLSLARQTGYVQRLTTIAVMLDRDFDEAAKQDIERLMRNVNARDWAEWTKDNYRVAVKRFWRWMKGLEKGKDPPETDWIRIGKAESKTILPEDLLTRAEAMKLIEAAEHPRDKAYVAAADESGAIIVVRGEKGGFC